MINCEINIILTWSANCFIIANDIDGQVQTFAVNGTKLYVPVVTLSTQDSEKTIRTIEIRF